MADSEAAQKRLNAGNCILQRVARLKVLTFSGPGNLETQSLEKTFDVCHSFVTF